VGSRLVVNWGKDTLLFGGPQNRSQSLSDGIDGIGHIAKIPLQATLGALEKAGTLPSVLAFSLGLTRQTFPKNPDQIR
jgi:hypothetical protein